MENELQNKKKKEETAEKKIVDIKAISCFLCTNDRFFRYFYDFVKWMVFKIMEIVEHILHIRVEIMFFTGKEELIGFLDSKFV